ncbi:hypothetical protein LTR15_004406 [Elasticomyces elasticus]|nr:hypothetical protein LTR15_004406 [Elasticomyces elasticus]
MSRPSSTSTKKREIIYEPLASLPHQRKFPRRRKTVHGLGLALAPPGLTKRQSSLTQLEGWAATPASHERDGKEVGEEENGEDEEYTEPSTKRRRVNVKARAREGRGSGSGSARRSSKKGLEKTDSQPTFTQAVRHISSTNTSDVESTSSAEEEEELPRAKTASTSRKAKPKPKTTTKKLEKTDSQPTFTQALRTAPVQRTKRPAQDFRIYDDHDIAETPMERAAKRRKMRGAVPEVMDLVALRDSGYETNLLGRGVERGSESPLEIAESSQVLGEGLDSDEAIVLGKAESVRKLRSRDVVSPARPTAAAREERRYPSLRLQRKTQAVVGERSPLKVRDANARSPVKQPRQAAKGKAEGRGKVVPGEESQVLAQQMLGVVGGQVVASSAVVEHDSEGEDDDDEEDDGENEHHGLPSGTAKKRSLARKTTIQDSSEGSDTESEVEDLGDSTPKPPALQVGQTVSIAESQLEHGNHADVEEAEADEDADVDANGNNDEHETAEPSRDVEQESRTNPRPRTSPRPKLKRVHTVQESQVDDFGVGDDEEWNNWDDDMGGGATLSKDRIRLPEPLAQGWGLKRKGGVLVSAEAEYSDAKKDEYRDGQVVGEEAGEEEEEGLEESEIVREAMLPPQPQARPRAQKLRRVGTVQESQPEDMNSDFDVPLDEHDDADITLEIAKEDGDAMPHPPEPRPRPTKLKRVSTVQDSQIDDFGEDLEMEWVAPLAREEAVIVGNAAMLAEEEEAATDEEDEVAVGEEDEGVVSEEGKAISCEDGGALVVGEDDVFEVEEELAVVEGGKVVAVEGEEFVDIDVLLADQERNLVQDRGFGGGVEAGKQSDVRRGGDEVLQGRSQLGADDVDAGGLRADLYEKSPAFVKAVNDAAELGLRRDASRPTARNEPAEAPEIEWFSTARERSSQRPASQLAESGNDGDAVEPVQNLVNNVDKPRFVDVEIIDLQSEDRDANAAPGVNHERPATRPLKSVELDVAEDDIMPPPSAGRGEQTKPIEIIELTSDYEDDEDYDDEPIPDLESANNDDDEMYYEHTYDPASAALDRDAARYAQRTQTQGWKQTQFSVYSHDLDEPAPVVRYRPFMTPGKVYKRTFDEPEEEWEDDEAGMQLEAELGEAVGGVVVSSQAAERNKNGVQMMVRDSQSAVADVSRTGGAGRDVMADEERVPSSPPALAFTKPALPELQPVLPAGDERVLSSPPAIRPSQVSTVGPTQLSPIRPGSRNGPSTETQWSLHSPPKFTQSRWQHQEETLSSSPLALPPWTSPERRRFADMGVGKGKGKQTVMGSMGGYSLGELEDFSLPPPPPISSSRVGTQSGRSSSPVVR